MLDRIANILKHDCGLDTNKTLIIGVSGGPDSLCLLHVLYHLGFPMIAVHINHGLRPEANEESKWVEQFVIKLGVNFVKYQIGVREYAREVSASIEEAARTLRYKTLFDHATKNNACAVVVGHNANDQVETVLMHFLRGSGLAGLRGMEVRSLPNTWSNEIPLIRPLLTTWREEIQKYNDRSHLNPIFDNSNRDVSFHRNRIRYELIPKLSEYNPSVGNVLIQMGQILKDDYDLLEKLTDEAWTLTFIKQQGGCLVFNSVAFLQQPISIQRHLLRRAISLHNPGLNNVDFECIERGLKLLVGRKQYSQTDLVGGLRILKQGEKFWIADFKADFLDDDLPVLQSGEVQIQRNQKSVNINEKWQLKIAEITKILSAEQQYDINQDPFQVWLDASDLRFPLIIRGRKPGDQIKPLGLNGHMIKISDLMINQKLPKAARADWPLVCSGDEILWVPGLRVSEIARVKPSTTRVIYLSLLRNRTT